ncbi:MAG: hypothetical protein ACI4JC_07355 [Faecalibacterium sp.]
MKKHLKKLAAMVLCCMMLVLTCSTSALAVSEDPNLLRYVPTEMTVTSSKVLVKGYFINMNSKATISNLKSVKMDIYNTDVGILASGDFGTIKSFSIKPQSMVEQNMEFSNSYGLNSGIYVCEEDTYAVFDCTYSVS